MIAGDSSSGEISKHPEVFFKELMKLEKGCVLSVLTCSMNVE